MLNRPKPPTPTDDPMRNTPETKNPIEQLASRCKAERNGRVRKPYGTKR